MLSLDPDFCIYRKKQQLSAIHLLQNCLILTKQQQRKLNTLLVQLQSENFREVAFTLNPIQALDQRKAKQDAFLFTQDFTAESTTVGDTVDLTESTTVGDVTPKIEKAAIPSARLQFRG